MKPKKRQKLCPNCDGEADLDVIVCPFCAADLTEERRDWGDASSEKFEGNQLSESLYPSQVAEKELEEEVAELREEGAGEPLYRAIGMIALFAFGVQLFLFSAFLFLFSHDGALVLKWSSRFWFLYLFASIPFLLFGYRAISKL